MNVSPGSTKMSEAKTKTKRRDVLVDIRIRREVLWVTTNIDRVLGLIHPNPVNPHLRRERQVVGIDEASKVSRHAQVHDEVLSESKINQNALLAKRREEKSHNREGTHHRLLRNRPRSNFYPSIRSQPTLVQRPRLLIVRYPSNILQKEGV